jgi:hypothetical protein
MTEDRAETSQKLVVEIEKNLLKAVKDRVFRLRLGFRYR